MKKILLIIFVSLLVSVNAYASSFAINENDKFECSWSEGNFLITILKKYNDNYFAIQKKIDDINRVTFGSFNGEYLEFLWFINKDFLNSELFTKENDKYLKFVLVVKLTKEQIINLESKKSKFDNKQFDKIQTLDLSEDEFKNEIEVHNFKLSIMDDIVGSDENMKKQGVTSGQVNCIKDKTAKSDLSDPAKTPLEGKVATKKYLRDSVIDKEKDMPPDVQQYLQYSACLKKIEKEQVPIELRAEEEEKCLNVHYPK